MSWSELWLAISSDLIYIIPFALITLIGFQSISDQVQPVEQKKIGIVESLFFIVIGGLTVLAVYFLWVARFYYIRIQMILAICLGVYFILIFTNEFKMMNPKGYFGFSFGMMIFMLTFVTTLDIRAVQNGRYNGTVIETENQTYISSDTSYFIGKTQDFVFIYRPRDFSTTIIPADKVQRIVFRSKSVR